MVKDSLQTNSKERGMTLIEILIAIAIIGILLATSFLAYRPRGQELALQRSVFRVASEIEKAREMAMSAQQHSSGDVPAGGYGVYFDTASPSNYILFADIDASKNRKTDGSEDVETISLEKGLTISALSPSGPVNITFVPPSPNVYLQRGAVVGEVDIAISIEGDPSKSKVVSVNKAGLISNQ